MKIQIKSDGYKTYMNLMDLEFQRDFYEWKILSDHEVDGLCFVKPVFFYEEKYISVDITGLVSLEEYEKRGRLLHVLPSFIYALEKEVQVLKENFLSENGLLLEKESIFFSDAGEVFFTFIPGRETSLREGMQHMMEYFIEHVNQEDKSDVMILYALYRKSYEFTVTPKILADYLRSQDDSADENRLSSYSEETQILYEELGLSDPSIYRERNILSNIRKEEKRMEEEKEREEKRRVSFSVEEKEKKSESDDEKEDKFFISKEKVVDFIKKNYFEILLIGISIIAIFIILSKK